MISFSDLFPNPNITSLEDKYFKDKRDERMEEFAPPTFYYDRSVDKQDMKQRNKPGNKTVKTDRWASNQKNSETTTSSFPNVNQTHQPYVMTEKSTGGGIGNLTPQIPVQKKKKSSAGSNVDQFLTTVRKGTEGHEKYTESKYSTPETETETCDIPLPSVLQPDIYVQSKLSGAIPRNDKTEFEHKFYFLANQQKSEDSSVTKNINSERYGSMPQPPSISMQPDFSVFVPPPPPPFPPPSTNTFKPNLSVPPPPISGMALTVDFSVPPPQINNQEKTVTIAHTPSQTNEQFKAPNQLPVNKPTYHYPSMIPKFGIPADESCKAGQEFENRQIMVANPKSDRLKKYLNTSESTTAACNQLFVDSRLVKNENDSDIEFQYSAEGPCEKNTGLVTAQTSIQQCTGAGVMSSAPVKYSK